jgi:DNA polymerase III delta prime subunit
LHLKSFLKDKFNIKENKNPDFFHEVFEIMGIDNSRKIKENHLSKSFIKDGKKIFIIECSGITHEAQNSLLKIFEEPNENSHFFLIMPSPNVLLPTLLSRIFILKKDKEDNKESMIQALKFLELSKTKKIDFVDEMAKDISDEKITKKDIQEFLNSLESILYENGIEENKSILKSIIKARDYMNDRSPSIKQLLEYIALNI